MCRHHQNTARCSRLLALLGHGSKLSDRSPDVGGAGLVLRSGLGRRRSLPAISALSCADTLLRSASSATILRSSSWLISTGVFVCAYCSCSNGTTGTGLGGGFFAAAAPAAASTPARRQMARRAPATPSSPALGSPAPVTKISGSQPRPPRQPLPSPPRPSSRHTRRQASCSLSSATPPPSMSLSALVSTTSVGASSLLSRRMASRSPALRPATASTSRMAPRIMTRRSRYFMISWPQLSSELCPYPGRSSTTRLLRGGGSRTTLSPRRRSDRDSRFLFPPLPSSSSPASVVLGTGATRMGGPNPNPTMDRVRPALALTFASPSRRASPPCVRPAVPVSTPASALSSVDLLTLDRPIRHSSGIHKKKKKTQKNCTLYR